MFELFTDNFDEFSFVNLKHELEGILDISNFTHELLTDKILGPQLFRAFKKIETEERRTDGYYMLIMDYARSPFRDFEGYLRLVVGLDEDYIGVILGQRIQILSPLKSNLVFIQIKIFQRLFTQKAIMMEA